MKKLWILLPMIILLTACSKPQNLETVSDPALTPEIPEAQQILLELPEGTDTPVLQNEGAGKVYFSDDLTITVQTLEGGDLAQTVKTCTGFYPEQITMLQTTQENAKRYDGVWTCVGEEQDQVGRLCVLDDGHYHYVVTAMASEEDTGKLQSTLKMMFDSVRLLPADVDLNTGS